LPIELAELYPEWLARAKPRLPAMWKRTAELSDRGLGEGLVGFCPGRALVNLAGLSFPLVAFVAAMAAGMSACDFWQDGRVGMQAARKAVAASDG